MTKRIQAAALAGPSGEDPDAVFESKFSRHDGRRCAVA
jgi:hypothetical protein